MNEQDRLYRLIKDIRGQLAACPDAVRLANALAAEGSDADGYRLRLAHCTLKRDWLEAIEHGLPYVERALEEERRFLRSRREVVRIDRAKRVSAESVRHLAQHSSYITRTDAAGEIVPDRLLVVEREDNFAIYENRFLFTLVSVLQNFVEKRFRAVAALDGTASTAFEIRRDIRDGDGDVSAWARFGWERPAAPDGARDGALPALFALRERINALNSTQLIKLLKGTPLVSSPIVRTNVIKKNANFRQALALYEFLESYSDPGYDTAAAETADRDGCHKEAARDFCSLLALQQGLARLLADRALLPVLELRFEEENRRREQERLRLEHEREAAVLARIEAARRQEAARWEAEAARRDRENARLMEELDQLQLTMRQYRDSMDRWERAFREQALQTQRRLEEEAERFRDEAVACARALSTEQSAHAATKERAAAAQAKQKADFEEASLRNDMRWQRLLHEEHARAEGLLCLSDRAHSEQIKALKKQHYQQLREERRQAARERERLRQAAGDKLAALKKAHREEAAQWQRDADARLKSLTRHLRDKLDAARRREAEKPPQWP